MNDIMKYQFQLNRDIYKLFSEHFSIELDPISQYDISISYNGNDMNKVFISIVHRIEDETDIVKSDYYISVNDCECELLTHDIEDIFEFKLLQKFDISLLKKYALITEK